MLRYIRNFLFDSISLDTTMNSRTFTERRQNLRASMTGNWLCYLLNGARTCCNVYSGAFARSDERYDGKAHRPPATVGVCSTFIPTVRLHDVLDDKKTMQTTLG